MTGIVTNPSRPALSRSETKSEITNNIARAIIHGEAEAREAKSLKLRNARLAMEARQAQLKSSTTRSKTAQKKTSRPRGE